MHIDLCFKEKLSLTLVRWFFLFQSDVSLTSMKEDMEAAKLQLKAYSHTLTELISKIGKSASNKRFFTVATF